MGASSETAIMNSALVKIGAERIVTPDDDSNRARLVKNQYPLVRDHLLRGHPWKFATARALLTALVPTPDNVWDYSFAFTLPSDCMRVLKTDLQDLDVWNVENGRQLVANQNPVRIQYVKRVTDVAQFDDNFCEVLAWGLAADIAYALTQSTQQKESAEKSYQRALAEARSFNAQQGSPPRVVADQVFNSRFR
jgi:hypothetical protein